MVHAARYTCNCTLIDFIIYAPGSYVGHFARCCRGCRTSMLVASNAMRLPRISIIYYSFCFFFFFFLRRSSSSRRRHLLQYSSIIIITYSTIIIILFIFNFFNPLFVVLLMNVIIMHYFLHLINMIIRR